MPWIKLITVRRGAAGLAAVAALIAALTAAQSAIATTPAAKKPPIVKVTVVDVVAGQPDELGFTLSKLSLIAPGTVKFKVVNKGLLSHDFKICTVSTKSVAKNSCVGKTTPVLKKGQSATLTVTLKKGEFEFLCTVPGHASAGMKGLIGIGVKLPGLGVTTPTTTTTTTPTTTTPPMPVGNAANGAAVFASAGCGSCHTLKAAGSTGTVGPNLDGLMPSQALVYTTVTNGEAGAMPPFSGQLTTQQIADVAAYVFQSTH